MITRLIFAVVLLTAVSSTAFAQSNEARYDFNALLNECGQSQDCRNQIRDMREVENQAFDAEASFETRMNRLFRLRALMDKFFSSYPNVWRTAKYVKNI